MRNDTRKNLRNERNERKGASSRCPICGKSASPENHPFCSQRCRDIDLGRWLKGSYAVPGERARDEIDDGGKDD